MDLEITRIFLKHIEQETIEFESKVEYYIMRNDERFKDYRQLCIACNKLLHTKDIEDFKSVLKSYSHEQLLEFAYLLKRYVRSNFFHTLYLDFITLKRE